MRDAGTQWLAEAQTNRKHGPEIIQSSGQGPDIRCQESGAVSQH